MATIKIKQEDEWVSLPMIGVQQFQDAPSDGKQYGRKNNEWAVIEAGSSTHTLDLSPLFDEEGSPVATVSDEFLAEVKKAYEEKYSNVLNFFLSPFILSASFGYSGGTYIITTNLPSMDGSTIALTYATIGINESTKAVQPILGELSFDQSGSGTKALTDNGQYAEFAKPTKVESGGSGTVTKQIKPNTFYKFGTVVGLTITFAAEESGIENEYKFEFVSGTTPTTLSLPDSVKWSGGNAPTMEANKTYQVSIVNNLAVYAAF